MNKQFQVEIGEESVALVDGGSLSEVLHRTLESNNLRTQRLIFVGMSALLAEVEDARRGRTKLKVIERTAPLLPISKHNPGIRRVRGRHDRKVTLVTDGNVVDVWATNTGGHIGHVDEHGMQLYAYVREGQGPIIASVNRRPTYNDWVMFRDSFEALYNIDIPLGYLPFWLNN